MEKVDIKDISGNIRFSTPINEGSKRKFLLMKEDYVTLKFSLDSPVYFQLGDYIELTDDTTTLFELVDLQKPTYNTSTGGYDYDLRFDAYYLKWKNKKFFFTPENAGREAGWSLTAPLNEHLNIFVKNLESLGYTYRGKAFEANIDFGVVEKTSKPLSYDNVNLIDALTIMAEAWECEWWIINDQIHFGRCEYNDPVDFEIGVNVETMERSDSQTRYATKLYAFGSTRNIPPTYRKKLVFDVKTVNGRNISDTARKLDIEYFPNSVIRKEEYNVEANISTSLTNNSREWIYYKTISDTVNGSTYKVVGNSISTHVGTLFGPANRIFLPSGEYVFNASFIYQIGGKEKGILIGSKTVKLSENQQYGIEVSHKVPNELQIEKGASDFRIRVYVRIPPYSVTPGLLISSSIEYNIGFISGSLADTTISFLSGINKGKIFSAVYNPNLLMGDDANVTQLPEGVTASLGDMYTIGNIIKGKVPAKYFSKDDAELTISGVVQTRLMLPADTPYVSAYRYSQTGERIDIGDERYDDPDNIEMPEEEAIEEIVIFEDEYAKYIGSTDIVPEPHEEEEEDTDGNKTGKILYHYSFKDKGLKNFHENYCLENEILRLSFQTGKLAGLDFSLILKESDDTGTTFEIVSNEDYGRSLPDDVLFPQAEHIENGVTIPADTYILYGFDTAYLSEDMLPNAEKSLLDKAKKYVTKTMIDPSTYICKMMSDRIYSNDGRHKLFEAGDRVNLISKAYFTDGRQSRIIGFEYNLDIPYDSPIYTVGETAAYSRIGEIESKIDSLTFKGQNYSGISAGGGGTGIGVYIIGVNDRTSPSNRNVLSALRALHEIKSRIIAENDSETELTDDNVLSSLRALHEIDTAINELYSVFLRKDQPDTAQEIITFLQGLISEGLITAGDGIQFGKSFASGPTGHGGRITASGHGELESLTLRRFLEVPELRYNRVDVTTGDKWSSPGGGLIESVEMDTDVAGNPLPSGIVTLKLEAGEIGAVAFDDLCTGIYHFESGNSGTDYDDGKGNRRFAGFTTVYFRITEIVETGLNSKFRFVLRDASENYPNPVPPCAMMNFVCFGNVSNKERQSSMYQTRTYTRYLKNVDWWEYSFQNIAMQFGDLSNLSVFGADMTGYSCYIDSLYFTGKIEQLEKVVENTLGTGDLRMEIDSSAGLLFVDNNIDTTLTAKILRYFKDVTGNVTAWSWTRESGTDQVHIASDAIWNEAHSSARESIHVTSDDLTTDSVKFICDATIDSKKIRKEITI